MDVSKLSASLITANQETNVALGTFNFDFSLLKVEAPKEYQSVGKELTSRRRKDAEDGSSHITARKLGALFQHSLPRTPQLIKAYGVRASKIISCRKVNPQPSPEYGPFAEHAGLDGTNLWAAATSGPDAVAIHLLACMLARVWERSRALAIWEQLVSERKKELQEMDSADPFYQVSRHLFRISVTTEQLSDWDTSTRAWLQGADEAMSANHGELHDVINRLYSIDVNGNTSLYKNVMQTWVRTMEVANGLVSGEPHSVDSGAILVGLSAWHLYPDMLLLQDESLTPTTLHQHDPLIAPGGLLTVGLQSKDGRRGQGGIGWSLSLGHLRYYGGPVLSRSHLDTTRNRVSFTQLILVAIGSMAAFWETTDPETGIIITRLWDYVHQAIKVSANKPQHWLGMLAAAVEQMLEANTLEAKQGQQLMRLGRRRKKEFLSLEYPIPQFFGLTQLTSLLSHIRRNSASIETSIKIIRQYARGVQWKDQSRSFVIAYKSRRDTWTFATATPIQSADYRTNNQNDDEQMRHQRWAQQMRPEPNNRAQHIYGAKTRSHKRRRLESEGEWIFEIPSASVNEVYYATTKKGVTNQIGEVDPWGGRLVLRWTTPPAFLSQFVITSKDEDSYADLVHVAGDQERVGLFMAISKSYDPLELSHHVDPEVILEAMGENSLDELSILESLEALLCSQSDFLLSMRALSTAREIYKLLPGATVDLGVTSKKLHLLPWVRESTPSSSWSLIPMGRGRTFSCVASFETGCFEIDPDSLENVIAIAVAGSIYITAPLLADPSETPMHYEVKRIVGSIGKPGIAFLIPPQTQEVRKDLDGENWELVNHSPFDGQLEDSFASTTMHLWFTEYMLPINVGDFGTKSFDAYFLESVISIHDKGKWVADVNILKELENVTRISCDTLCEKRHRSYAFNLPMGSPRLTMVDDWNEILDGPEFVGIVRSRGNWLARLATACLSSQLGYQTYVLADELCWDCVLVTWHNRCGKLTATGIAKLPVKELFKVMTEGENKEESHSMILVT